MGSRTHTGSGTHVGNMTRGELDTRGRFLRLGSASDPQGPQLGSRVHWLGCDPPGRGCQQCQVCPSAPLALILTWAPMSPERLRGSQTQLGVPHSGGGVGGDETLPFQVLGGCPGSRNLPEKHWRAPSTRIVWSCSEEGAGPYCGTAWHTSFASARPQTLTSEAPLARVKMALQRLHPGVRGPIPSQGCQASTRLKGCAFL